MNPCFLDRKRIYPNLVARTSRPRVRSAGGALVATWAARPKDMAARELGSALREAAALRQKETSARSSVEVTGGVKPVILSVSSLKKGWSIGGVKVGGTTVEGVLSIVL